MPYAYVQQINHVFDTDHLNIWVTFHHQMLRSSDPTAEPPVYDIMPPLEKWLLEADEVAVDIIDSEWIDEFTLLLTSDTVAAEPTGVTLAYDGPDEDLAYRWGKQIEPWGQKESFAGYPTTPAPHNSTHENGGADEINIAGLSGLLADTQLSYTDRGDPAAPDFVTANFTTDATWREWDLSGIVPEGTKAVTFSLYIIAPATNKTMRFRKKGNTNIYNITGAITQAININNFTQCVVGVDNDRKAEYYGSLTVFTGIQITITGWWK
jgi:hypothetical protein